jgi:catechol 2,3-dioxygenase-like lactoylglutathione lyase family enzyme
MFEHVSIGVRDLDRAVAFYDAVLRPLGYGRVMLFDEPTGTRSAGYGQRGDVDWAAAGGTPFWLEERVGADIACPPGCHFCFHAPDRKAVMAFHAEGLARGATDNGAPGLRLAYGPTYYAAFLIDPDGWRIEAVTFSLT